MGVRGLKGDIRVMSLTDAPERLAAGQRVIVEGETAPREILEAGIAKHGLVLRLRGIADRDAAAALIGKHLIGQTEPDTLPPGTYWWHELEGLEVVTPDGRSIGVLEEVFRAGTNEVYRVVGPDGEVLVPAIHSVVVDIDLASGRMTIHDPAEWLEEV
jgi:16S rRNA processing protein RimM